MTYKTKSDGSFTLGNAMPDLPNAPEDCEVMKRLLEKYNFNFKPDGDLCIILKNE